MGCLTGNFVKGCSVGSSTVRRIIIGDVADLTSITAASGTGIITSVVMVGSTTAYEYQINPQTASVTETPEMVANHGGTAYKAEVNFYLPTRAAYSLTSGATRNRIAELGTTKSFVVFKDGDAKWYLVGATPTDFAGLEVTGGAGTTGVNQTDFSGWNVILGGSFSEPAYQLHPSNLSAIGTALGVTLS